MRSSRRGFLIGCGTLAMGRAWAQSSRPLLVTGARPTIFYAPLIATVTRGFLKKHGVEATFHWLGAMPLLEGLRGGTVDVIQSAVSSYWTLSDRGETNIPVHIAEINRRDGFFLVRRGEGAPFDWKQLEGKTIVAELGGQPAHMLRYAMSYNKVDTAKVQLVDGGTGAALRAAFLPAPQTSRISRARPPSRWNWTASARSSRRWAPPCRKCPSAASAACRNS
jgi:ABC-type nitrate/sulfonate/bicarbonate transport system substrate-binding protein